MPNTTVRATARTLPESTNRRAVLGAVLAAGAAGATAALPSAASVTPALSALDRRILNLWRWRAKLNVIGDHRWKQFQTASDALPAWADSGQKFIAPDGRPVGRSVELPEVVDLSRRPIRRDKLVNVRPSAEDLADEFKEAILSGVPAAAAREELARSLTELDDRLREQAAVKDRLGVDILADRSQRATDAQCDLEDSFGEHIGTSVLALGAACWWRSRTITTRLLKACTAQRWRRSARSSLA
jgi:hypothetical protein